VKRMVAKRKKRRSTGWRESPRYGQWNGIFWYLIICGEGTLSEEGTGHTKGEGSSSSEVGEKKEKGEKIKGRGCALKYALRS